ncbi:hypothetical protein BBP40_001978 [Aspergillus hancockii]|nr:hypothetical protein BBP40_001978 [Aspergillus hancockii]
MASARGPRWQQFLQEMVMVAGTSASAYFLIRYLISRLDFDPESQKKEEQRRKSAAILRKLDGGVESDEESPRRGSKRGRRTKRGDLVLNQYEQAIAMDVVAPDDIPVSFEDIGGLDEIIEELKESVIYPLTMPHLKLQPAIVFIDEIDAVLGTRRSGEHEASGMVKAEFMTHWDGLTSANSSGEPQRVVVMGATNRIQDIDDAILRRMPKKFPVVLPPAPQRLRILSLVLKDTKVDRENFDLEYLVKAMAGMSGSDIKEACRDAAMAPVRELIRQKKAAGLQMTAVDPKEVRGLRTEDFFTRAGGVRVIPPPAPLQSLSRASSEKEWSTASDGVSDVDPRPSADMAEPPE